uniref:Uncharacterized protein n=1 Tax=Phaeomonas parva TaxID=124430 RepID=A0A7S1XVF5_9STRA|mmetsp:Transcript_37618/g.117599  ORF Transcript_37618/g.117599 Transcript_37618/m.117599 type:complete len:225 (+) Transcript_37618:119-793(+)
MRTGAALPLILVIFAATFSQRSDALMGRPRLGAAANKGLRYAAPGQQQRRRLARARAAAPTMGVEGLWEGYLGLLAAQPLLTKSVTASVIIGAGDSAAQAIELAKKSEEGATTEGKNGLDIVRIARWAFFGLVLQAPWNHYFFLYLDQFLPPTADPFTLNNLAKVGIDQGVQSPMFTALCFIFLSALEGKSMEQIKDKLDAEYVPTMFTSWKVRAACSRRAPSS